MTNEIEDEFTTCYIVMSWVRPAVTVDDWTLDEILVVYSGEDAYQRAEDLAAHCNGSLSNEKRDLLHYEVEEAPLRLTGRDKE